MAAKEHKERKELLAERGCVRSTSRSTSDRTSAVLTRTCCGWVCDHSRAPLDCGGRAQRRHRLSTGDGASKAARRFASRRSPNKFSCSYVALYSLRFLAILGVLVLPAVFLYAEDLTILDGKTYTNITDVAKYPNLVVFTCNENRISVAISNLPAEFRAKYDVKEQAKKSVLPTISQPANSTDLFLDRNRDTDLFECDSDTNMSGTNRIDKSWQLCLHGVQVSLTSYETDWNTTPEKRTSQFIHFNLGQEGVVNQVFDKFVEWDDVAVKNKPEPFEKEIGRCRDAEANQLGLDEWLVFSFHWDNRSTLWASYGGMFDREDVIYFREILKRLPSFKEKLAERIRNKETQKNLFK
jgi:hypothetical protein